MMRIGVQSARGRKGPTWRGPASYAATVAAVLLAAGAVAAAGGAGRPAGPSDQPEAYFNGTSYVRLAGAVSLHRLVGISFRSCVGGELFSQRYESHTVRVAAVFEGVVAAFTTPARGTREVRVRTRPLDNRWHFVALRYDAAAQPQPTLTLAVDNLSAVVANATYNADLLSTPALEADGAALLVGSSFSGCVREGPQLEFHTASAAGAATAASAAQAHNVLFGPCPLTTDQCKDRRDVLTTPPVDHCYHEPCMRHGTCISRHDRYECHCTARYSGNNCEHDNGNPCDAEPCRHQGRCVVDRYGDYTCHCPDSYHGEHCELELSLDPLCVAGPCRNNGSCSVPPGARHHLCTCQPGYTGSNCEIDMDECVEAGPAACDNGGRCVDAVNNFTCDCTGTGYTGVRCETNVNECAEEPHICGHGQCYDTYGSFVCACQPGYAGDRCQTKMSACASSPCGAGGSCVETGGGWRCRCARGWTGARCTTPLVGCDNLLCPPHSRCVQTPGVSPMTGMMMSTAAKQVQCVCELGFYGAPGLAPNCSALEDVCDAGVCLNGATCTLAADHFNCTCLPGFRGAYCEQAVGKALSELKAPAAEMETCADSPCLHARACADHALGFHCECEAGWAGARCELPACSAELCRNGASCKNTAGGARCYCRPGFTGARCERSSGAADACSARPCQHGGVCRAGAGADFTCECRAGYAGPLCEDALDCRTASCKSGQMCVEKDMGYVCQTASPKSPCASSPCHNSTCQALSETEFKCVCEPGYTGRFCEIDIDECMKTKICNHGVCINTPGSFQCYCTPGYTGDRCELDIDECLSTPCKNNGTCQNLENNYGCICKDGFTGKDCSVNIDECETNPCAAGATCVDGIASYSCVCQDGVTGANCEIDIDDCESAPCLHGGRCQDALNSYTCDCTDTGFTGDTCSVNIDECAPAPCRHGATCRDLLNDYECRCRPGYTGKNCEIDIPECESSPCQYEGVCLERSNTSLYRDPTSEAELVGPHPSMLLPDVFYRQFSYENASGFECVCVPGIRGARCEVNVDECASSPCGAWGKCEDGVGGYRCVCHEGFEGDHCQVDIDECDRYKPCAHGQCYDRRAAYHCECEAGWGGHNCSVWLTGCAGRPCLNNGTCLPWLLHETEHRFNCSCGPGFYGNTCERITSMSLDGRGYAEVMTVRDEGYDISFRFRTTLPNGLLAIGKGQTFYFLELANGRLNLHSSLLNKWEGVFIGSDLNNSEWQKVFVTINSSHLVLAANEEQTIYPISQNEVSNSSATSFPATYLAGAGASYTTFTHGPVHFVGCFQDVLINGQWVLPETTPETEAATTAAPDAEAAPAAGGLARVRLVGVTASCPRTPQCQDNPCKSGGACEDQWTSFTCKCPRPYLGMYCQYNYTAATFGHEGARVGAVVAVEVREAARKAVHAALDISMFVRTRQPTGQIFYLGSRPKYGVPEETSVAASLKAGELLVNLRFNHTPEEYTVGGTRLDNGHLHLIQVVRNSTLVQVKLNGTEYFRKSISAAKQLDAQVLYLGGPPPAPAPPTETTPTAPAAGAAPPTTTLAPVTVAAATAATALAPVNPQNYFKGVIQDVQVSNGMRVMIVEFFPLKEPELALPPAFGDVTLDAAGVLPGVVSDDTCAANPCLHNATCHITWNDYTCECPRGYKGKSCAEVEFCQLQGCPTDSQCRNLDGGYECVANATFDGVNTSLTYQLELGEGSEGRQPPPIHSLTLTYRSKTGGTLLYAEYVAGGNESARSVFSLGVFRDQLSVQWQLPGDTLRQQKHFRKHAPDHDWTTLHFLVEPHQIRGGFGDWTKEDKPAMTAALDGAAWSELMARGVVSLGGVRTPPVGLYMLDAATDQLSTSDDLTPWITNSEEWNVDSSVGEYFKGCIGEVHLGDLLLPFYTREKLFVGPTAALLAAAPHYELVAGRPWNADAGLGCVLCLERDCQHGGHCKDIGASYDCECPAGYSGDHCQQDTDECRQHECKNNATCVDGVAGYTCVCRAGWEGTLCDVDVDECASSPCQHGGACADGVGGFRCACAAEWAGPVCAAPRRTSCAHAPCAPNRAICLDTPYDPVTGNNFTCQCLPGYVGVLCEEAFCEARPCENGGTCVADASPPVCACAAGWTGARCELETDECAGPPGAGACLHGGRCVDRFDDFVCDCNNTGYKGARCERDTDECAEQPCGPGLCQNLNGTYLCVCEPGLCGAGCLLADPCYAPPTSPPLVTDAAADASHNGSHNASRALPAGPCEHGGECHQQCTAVPDYRCHCVDGWGGKNCSEQVGVWELEGGGGGGGVGSTAVLVGVAGALGAVALAAGVLLALAAQARNKRATRGTYSPSSQEYCNPRAEHLHNALKPPPEERLI